MHFFSGTRLDPRKSYQLSAPYVGAFAQADATLEEAKLTRGAYNLAEV